jgi:mono/diheme cytochrome c family protein
LLSAGCASDDTADTAPRALGEIRDADLTVAKFKDICEDRGGLTQVHASCGGTNSCRGLIYNTWAGDTIVEHTCRGFNSCLGISCVDMPADSGKSGQDVYEENCTGCHAHSEVDGEAGTFYAVFVHPGVSDEDALAAFMAKSDATLVNNVAFGSMGYYPDGTPYSNMPAYHEDISLAETRRVVEYLTGLEARTEVAVALGINQEIDTSGE